MKSKNYTAILEALREEFPKADKPGISRAMNTPLTGVEFCARAKELVEPIVSGQKRVRRDRGPGYTRWEVKLSREVSEVLKIEMENRGFSTKQAFLENLLLEVLQWKTYV